MPSATMTKDNKKGSKPPKHWTQRAHECVITRDDNGSINIAVKGGAENGAFPFLSDIRQDRIQLRSGKLHVDEILLEVNGHKLAGYTLWDIEALFKHLGDVEFHLRLVKPGQTLNKDLRRYLNMRFQKGSIDHDLQSTIRENLYVRTVPCTTRGPRDGEVDGVDYKFLSVDEFMALEKSGHLLESGIFEGNHYGTPKPPQYPPNQGPHPHHNEDNDDNTSKRSNDHRPGGRPSAPGKRARNKSTITATTLNASPLDEEEQRRREQIERLEEELGELPGNWEIAFTEQSDMYFIDHESAATQWLDPRLESKQKQELLECEDDELPYGWEKIEDPQYGTYYIDHINRKTQYENPVVLAKAAATQSASSLPRHGRKPPPPPIRAHSESDLPKHGNGSPSVAVTTTSDEEWKAMFTKHPEELKGEKIVTTICKSTVGFGFTIVGGDDPEEFLQIKSVVPNGPAYSDGILKTGDVLVHVNETLVLGYTHHEVVAMFQTIKPGQKVRLEVCRGYPLPFDPDDPNTNIVTSYANLSLPAMPASPGSASIKSTQSYPERLSNHVSPMPHSASNDLETASRSSHHSGDHDRHATNHVKSMPELTPQSSRDSDYKVPVLGVNLKPGFGLPNDRGSISSDQTSDSQTSNQSEMHAITFVKGTQGFGFTVADSPYGQKVKQILAPQRCKTLREGDILMEINKEYIRDMPHNAVVQRLKECPQGQETIIVVQRGGMLKPVRGISKNKSPSSKTSQSSDVPKLERSTSDHSLGSANKNHPIANRDDELRSSSDEFERRSQEDMRRLKRIRGKDKEKLSPAHEKSEPEKERKNHDKGHDRLNGRYQDSDRESEDRHSHHSHHSDRDRRHPPEWDHVSKRSPDRRIQEPKSNHIHKQEVDLQHASPQSDRDRRRDPRQNDYQRQSPQRDPRGGGHDRRGGPPDRRPRDDYEHRDDRRVNDYDHKSLDRHRGPGPSDPHRRGEHEPRTRETDRRRPKTPNYDSRSLPPDEIRRHNPKFANEWHDDLRDHNKGEKGRRYHKAYYKGGPSSVHKQDDSLSRRPPSRGQPKEDADGSFIETTVFLKKHADGFGFRIVGGHEEGSQVSIGTITPGGAADVDGRLLTGDELLYVDGQTVVSASHRKVVTLMKNANDAGRVSLGIKRRLNPQQAQERPQQPPVQPLSHQPQQQQPYHQQQQPRQQQPVQQQPHQQQPHQQQPHQQQPHQQHQQQPHQQQPHQQQPHQQQPHQQQTHQQQPHQQQSHHQHQQHQRAQPQRLPPQNQVPQESGFPYDITLSRRGNEGFGFVILSSTLKSGSKIGRIIPGSPADRSPSVNVGDRLIAVNNIDITMLDHKDIVNIIKDTGSTVTLTIAAPEEAATSPNSPKGSEPMFSAMAMPAHVKHNDQQYAPKQPENPYISHNAMAPQSPPNNRRAEILYAQPAQWSRPVHEATEPRRFENRQQQQPTPIPTHNTMPPQSSNQFYRQPVQDQIEPGEYYSVELGRSPKGFGFSIRGGREYQNTPLFVLRMAIDGPAVKEGRMMVGDQLIEINGYNTDGMLHTEAIAAIKSGGSKVRLLLRRSGKPPVMDVNINPRRYTQTPPPTFMGHRTPCLGLTFAIIITIRHRLGLVIRIQLITTGATVVFQEA
ncbi:membrane-associated guanylate kinase, WW and PDZ domain-containing protein 2-like isoform X3 [Amphiura filiformis]|uniref:membrane-associated guanylate kinase, WW and PDZ domain-containing protein 2-like isoform X3 n=1 Tax=Amphiura filiformis TaxID=82378 RepID=UPI003B223CEC